MNRTKEKIAELNHRINVRRQNWFDILKTAFDNELVQLLMISLYDFAENIDIGIADNSCKYNINPGFNYEIKVLYGDNLEAEDKFMLTNVLSFNHTPYPCFITGLQMNIEENCCYDILTNNGANYTKVLADIKDGIMFLLNYQEPIDELPHLVPFLKIEINHESKIIINDKAESNENKKVLFVFIGNDVLSRKDYQLGAMKGLHFLELSESDILQLSDYEKMDAFISSLRIKVKKEV